jgi:hypothetical protein
MALLADSGTWLYRPPPDNDVLFTQDDGSTWVIEFTHTQPNFFGFFCARPLTGTGVIAHDDASMDEITWSIWTGCV